MTRPPFHPFEDLVLSPIQEGYLQELGTSILQLRHLATEFKHEDNTYSGKVGGSEFKVGTYFYQPRPDVDSIPCSMLHIGHDTVWHGQVSDRFSTLVFEWSGGDWEQAFIDAVGKHVERRRHKRRKSRS
jgi:hypothetical protein